MKVLHFTRHFFPEYSGTSTRLYNLLCRLPSEVCIITSDRKISGEKIPQTGDRYENVEVRRVPIPADRLPGGIPALRYPGTLYGYYRISGDMVKTIGDEKWDIVQAHNVLPFAGAALKTARTRQAPFILELHGIAEESLRGIARFAGNIYLQQETRRLVKNASHVVTLTHSLQEWIGAHYQARPEKITVVPNGADTERFSPKDEYQKKAVKLKVDLGIAGKVVMYAGAIDRINGLGELADAIPQVIKNRPDTCFVFIGNGPELPKLLSLSSTYPQHVRCLDQVPYAEMPVYYQMGDVFIIPRPSTVSSETLTPLKLLEAMASGRAVLGSNVGGIAEVVRHGENGYLYQKGDLTSLKNTLLEVLDADNITVGQNARQTITGNYTWEKSSSILWRLYGELTGKRAGS